MIWAHYMNNGDRIIHLVDPKAAAAGCMVDCWMRDNGPRNPGAGEQIRQTLIDSNAAWYHPPLDLRPAEPEPLYRTWTVYGYQLKEPMPTYPHIEGQNNVNA